MPTLDEKKIALSKKKLRPLVRLAQAGIKVDKPQTLWQPRQQVIEFFKTGIR